MAAKSPMPASRTALPATISGKTHTRLPMGQISLVRQDGYFHSLSDAISNVKQKLDLWQGVIIEPVHHRRATGNSRTVSHPELSLVAFRIKSPLLKSGKLKPAFAFLIPTTFP